MEITQCLHIAVLVSDLKRAENFYSNILGLSKSPTRPLKFAGIWYQIGEYQIHLIEQPTVTPRKIINQEKWGQNPHLALAVKDLQVAIEKLQNHNCPIQKSASGRAAVFTQDPDSNIIELSQIVG